MIFFQRSAALGAGLTGGNFFLCHGGCNRFGCYGCRCFHLRTADDAEQLIFFQRSAALGAGLTGGNFLDRKSVV